MMDVPWSDKIDVIQRDNHQNEINDLGTGALFYRTGGPYRSARSGTGLPQREGR